MTDHVLILTPVKNAARYVETYVRGLSRLTYPRHLVSVAVLESDSSDETYELFERELTELNSIFRRANLYRKNFGYQLPRGYPRYANHLQVERRTILAKSRNHLLFRALDDEDWVLWL